MNDLFHNFHFLRPWLLVFLLLPMLLFFKKLKTGGNASSWADVCDKNLLNFLLVSNSGQRHFSVKKLIYTGLAVAAIAAAGPAWKKTEIPFPCRGKSEYVCPQSGAGYATYGYHAFQT